MRKLSALFVLMLAGVAAIAHSAERTYPNRTVTVVVPFTPGDGSDIAARLASDELAKIIGQSVVVMNKPGAGGAIGVESALKAAHDGYTVLFTTNTPLTIRRVVDPATAPYDPQRDLIPLGAVARFSSVIAVRRDSPFNELRQLVEWGKKNPGKLRFGTPGFGSLGELNLGILNSQTGIDIVPIPYKSSTPAVTDLLGGHVDGVATSLSALQTYLQDGSLRAIAISRRFPAFDIPMLSESAYKEDILGLWVGFFAPAGTSRDSVDVLVSAIRRVTENRELAAKLLSNSMLMEYVRPEVVSKELIRETDVIAGIVRQLTKPR